MSLFTRLGRSVTKQLDKVQGGVTKAATQALGIAAKTTGTLTPEQKQVADVVFPQLDCLKEVAVQKLIALAEEAVVSACDRGRPEVSRVGLKLALESLRAAVLHVTTSSGLGAALDVEKLKVPPGVLVQAAMVATGLYNEIVESLKAQLRWEALCVETIDSLVELMQFSIVQDRVCLNGLKATGKGLVEIDISDVQRKWSKRAAQQYNSALHVARAQIGVRLTIKSREIVEKALSAYASSGQCAPPIDATLMCSGMTGALTAAVAAVSNAAATSTTKLCADIVSRGAYGAIEQPNIIKYKGFKKADKFVEEVVAAKIEEGGAGSGTTDAVVSAFSSEANAMPALLVAIVQELVSSVTAQIDMLFAKIASEGSADFDFGATAVAPLLARWQAESNAVLDRSALAAREAATGCVPGMTAVVMQGVVENLLAQTPFSSALLRSKTAAHHDVMVEAGIANTKDTARKYNAALGDTLAAPLRGYCAAAWVRSSIGSVVPAVAGAAPAKVSYDMATLKRIGNDAASAQIGTAVDRMHSVCKDELMKINGEWLGHMMMGTWQSVGPLRSVLVTGSKVTLDLDTTTFDIAAFKAAAAAAAAADGAAGNAIGGGGASAAPALPPPSVVGSAPVIVASAPVVVAASPIVEASEILSGEAAAPAFELSQWLEGLGLGEYEGCLRGEGFDSMISLRELEKDDLKEIGITKLGHRKAIIKAITLL